MTDWKILVRGVSLAETEATEELYARLRGFQQRLGMALGRDEAQDAYHDLIIRLVEQIRLGRLRNPDALPGYAQVIMRRMVALRVRDLSRHRLADLPEIVVRDPAPDPLAALLEQERADVACRLAATLKPVDREIMAGRTRHELGMTPTQYRLRRWRAKARLTARYRARMSE